MRLSLLHSFFLATGIAHAAVTVYGPHVQAPFGTQTAASASFTHAATYDNVSLTPPPPPSPPPPTSFSVQLQTSGMTNLSVPQPGSFFGFSIEFTVVTQVLGLNSSFLQVPFLNLMANIRERVGNIHIRVGGNTQEFAVLVDSIPSGVALQKNYANSSNPTGTPTMLFTPEIIKMMAEISALTNVQWYMGIPFIDPTNWHLDIAETAESMLGGYLAGFQAGNEPDLYARHHHRPANYSPSDYYVEFGELVQAVNADANMPVKNVLIAPSLATNWTPEAVWATGFVPSYKPNLAALAMERYPTNNCFARYNVGLPINPQAELATFLTHASAQNIISRYLNSSVYAQQQGLPFIMMETNSASCGGIPGISDTFAASLWAVDYALQMAYSNFTHAMFHVGGESDFYNPFTPPVRNQSTYDQWTIGPVYYSSLFVAETMGASNQSQVLDLQMNAANPYTPGYAIYENGQPTRVAMINFVDDPSGASDYTASISIGGTVPSQVQVKYLLAASVTQKHDITWANQTFGAAFSSDGRPVGIVDIQTVNCDQTNNVCNVKVPAPGAALVFLSQQALAESNSGPTMTFPTTALTKGHVSITVDPSVLATSNGERGISNRLADTSRHDLVNGAFGLAHALPSFGALVVGTLLVVRMTTRW